MSSITVNARKQWSNFYISFTVKQGGFFHDEIERLLNIPDLENIYTFHHWKYYRKKNSEFYFPRNDRQINSSQFSYWEYLENQTQLNAKTNEPREFYGRIVGPWSKRRRDCQKVDLASESTLSPLPISLSANSATWANFNRLSDTRELNLELVDHQRMGNLKITLGCG